MNSLFLLCDVIHQADFAKVNLKILEKIKGIEPQLKRKEKQFMKASNLKYKGDLTHDAITHYAIPPYVGRKIEPDFKTRRKFTPLNRFIDNDDMGYKNSMVERVTDGLEALPMEYFEPEMQKMYQIGRALRKKKLSPEDKLLSTIGNPTTSSIIKGRQPTQEDVITIRNSLKERGQQPKQQPKTKGSKPAPTTIEEKQQKLKQKYGIT